MCKRLLCLTTVLALCIVSGCKRGETEPAPLASIHWLGTRTIAADSNAVNLVKISQMPESRRLLNQTLDKLALAPWRAEFKGTDWDTVTNYPPMVATNAHARLLRPLLDDMLASESFIQTRKADKKPAQFALAVRLEPDRIPLWRTNLGILTATKGSFLSGAKYGQSGQWTLVASEKAGEALLAEVKARAQVGTSSTSSPSKSQAGTSSTSSQTKPSNGDAVERVPTSWLEGAINFANMARALDISHSALANLPEASVVVTGSRGGVKTRADLQFAKPLQIELDPWLVPTNIIRDPLIGFSAGRGIGPLLGATEFWKNQKLGTPPNQVYFWAQRGMPWFHFFGLPSKDAEDQMKNLGKWILDDLNETLASSNLGYMTNAGGNRFTWRGIPIFMPNIGVGPGPGIPVIYGGFYKQGLNRGPMPAELLGQLHAGTNVVWYDWEFTGPCIEGWLGISQMSKHALRYPRLTHKPGFDWLSSARTNLANCTTVIKKEGAGELALARDSAIGLNAAELMMLVDWLESPDFPAGLHTLRAERPPPTLKKAGNWSSATVPTNEAPGSPATPQKKK
jgi:hypothetical protein